MYMYIYICIYIYIYLHIYAYVYIYVCTHTHTHVYIYIAVFFALARRSLGGLTRRGVRIYMECLYIYIWSISGRCVRTELWPDFLRIYLKCIDRYRSSISGPRSSGQTCSVASQSICSVSIYIDGLFLGGVLLSCSAESISGRLARCGVALARLVPHRPSLYAVYLFT